MSEQENQEEFIDKEKYKEMTPLLNENFDGKTEKDRQNDGDAIAADNDARFNNHTKYSDTRPLTEKKIEKTSKAVKFFEKNENLSWLAPVINFMENKISDFFSLFRYTPLFFEKNEYFKVVNFILFLMVYICVLVIFFNGSIALLPIFFVLLDLIYYYSHIKLKRKGEPKSLIFDKNKYFIGITAIEIIFFLYLFVANLDWNFRKSIYLIEFFTMVTYGYVLLSFYSVTRKHFTTTILGFVIFYMIASQGIFVINWNANWSNESTTFNHTNKLSYTYYTAKNKENSVIEEVKPQDFFKIQTATNVEFGVFYVDTIYTYKLNNNAIQKIKNAKCLKMQLINCPTNKNAPKYIKNAKNENSFIQTFEDYNIFLKYQLSTLQQDFIDELKIKINQPFKESDYDDDIKTLYQIHINKENKEGVSIREKLGLSILDVKIESVRLGQTLFDKNNNRSRFQ